jgi:hypothetical protein
MGQRRSEVGMLVAEREPLAVEEIAEGTPERRVSTPSTLNI